MALLGVEFGGEIADVGGLDLAGLDPRRLHRTDGRLAHPGDEMLALLGPVAGEIGLRSTKDVYRRRAHRGLLIDAIRYPTKVRP